MSKKLRAAKPSDLIYLTQALYSLGIARTMLAQVGAEKSIAKVRSAIKSTEGALRHAKRCLGGVT